MMIELSRMRSGLPIGGRIHTQRTTSAHRVCAPGLQIVSGDADHPSATHLGLFGDIVGVAFDQRDQSRGIEQGGRLYRFAGPYVVKRRPHAVDRIVGKAQ